MHPSTQNTPVETCHPLQIYNLSPSRLECQQTSRSAARHGASRVPEYIVKFAFIINPVSHRGFAPNLTQDGKDLEFLLKLTNRQDVCCCAGPQTSRTSELARTARRLIGRMQQPAKWLQSKIAKQVKRE